eukprot:c4560_g2_i1 orf=170-1129(+)
MRSDDLFLLKPSTLCLFHCHSFSRNFIFFSFFPLLRNGRNPNSNPKKLSIKKITSTNYRTWSVKIEMLLARSELWGYVDGTIPSPGIAHADYTTWKLANTKAKSDIILHLGARQIELIQNLATSHEVWNKLKTTYKHADVASQVSIHRKLMRMQLRENQSVPEFLEHWQGVLDEAMLARLNIPLKQQVTMLLAALSPSRCPFVTTQSNTTNLTLPLLISKLMQEEVMRNLSENPDTRAPSSALATTMFHHGRGCGHIASSSFPRSPQSFSSNRGEASATNDVIQNKAAHNRFKILLHYLTPLCAAPIFSYLLIYCCASI